MAFDPSAPYGELVGSTVRLVTWNVWGRYGDAPVRQRQIDEVLAAARPDIVCLTEAWAEPENTQADHVAAALGLDHRLFSGDLPAGDGWTSGTAVASRWPIAQHRPQPLTNDRGEPRGAVTFASVDGPRGAIDVFVVMLDYPLGASAVRQRQVRQLLELVAASAPRGHLTVVCGDFNAGPDSDEMRMLTGAAPSPVPGLVFYDAWEVAGDGGPGHTFSRRNVLAAPSLFPDRRFDYVLTAWPRRGGLGHPVGCEVIGTAGGAETPASDHYGVLADLRY